MTIFLIILMTAFGLVLGSFGFIRSTWVDFTLMLILGMGNGYIGITLFTWMELRTPKDILGRMMSIMMLSNTGLAPISQAIAGAVSKWNLTILFVGAGILVLLVAVWTALQPELKTFSASMAAGKPGVQPETAQT
jgi:hypothetical protein